MSDYFHHLFAINASTGLADAVEMSGGGSGHVITNGAVYAEVIPLSQRVPVQHRSAAETATAADEVQPSVSESHFTVCTNSMLGSVDSVLIFEHLI